jgi:predicted XRE-type DNA-binding protein
MTWMLYKRREVERAIGEDFVKIKEEKYYNQDDSKANELTIRDVLKNLNNAQYDGDVNLEIIESDKLSSRSVIKAAEIYKKNRDALFSNETHDLEEPQLVKGLKYLTQQIL